MRWLARLGSAAAAAMFMPPAPAEAGAWVEDKGRGAIIVTAHFTEADRLLAAKGTASRFARSRKRELYAFGEFGLTDWLTVLGQTTLTDKRFGGPFPVQYTGADYTELGARLRVLTLGSAVFSTQASIKWPGATRRDGPAVLGNTGVETDFRFNAGYSFQFVGFNAFMDGSAGYHTRAGRPPNEFRADMTLGARPLPDWLVLLQSFNKMSDGGDSSTVRKTGFARYREHKLQASLVWDITLHWSAQLGASAMIAGENVPRERGIFTAVWRRF